MSRRKRKVRRRAIQKRIVQEGALIIKPTTSVDPQGPQGPKGVVGPTREDIHESWKFINKLSRGCTVAF